MDVWTPHHDAPHLLEWWRPLLLVARRAREDRLFWPIHIDEFQLIGRARRQGGRPDIWIYEHHTSRGPIYADKTGSTYRFISTPRARGPGQFRSIDVRRAVWGAGLPDVVEPIWYEPPREGWEAHWQAQDDAAASQTEPEPLGRQHGHLMVIDGQS